MAQSKHTPDVEDDLPDPRDEMLMLVSATLDEALDLMTTDWNDLGELTIQFKGRTYRGAFEDITGEED